MRATRIRDLVLVAVGAGVLAWLIVRGFYGDLPRLQWYVSLSLPILGVAELITGFQLRARIQRRRGAVPVEPMVAAHAMLLAKASAIVGALMAGVWAGLLGYVMPHRDVLVAAQNDTRVGIAGLVGALLLVGAALWLEYCCRTPEPPEDPDRDQTVTDDPTDEPRRPNRAH